jgi:hypothetical protein
MPDIVESAFGVGCSQMRTVGSSDYCVGASLALAGCTYTYNLILGLEGTWVNTRQVRPVAAGFGAFQVGLVVRHAHGRHSS